MELEEPIGVTCTGNLPLNLGPLTRVGDGSNILHDVFTGFCFSSSAFT